MESKICTPRDNRFYVGTLTEGLIVTKVNCNLCGSSQQKVLVTKGKFKVVKCLGCGLTYTNPREAEKKNLNLYSGKYFHIQDFNDKNIRGYRSYEKDKKFHKQYFVEKLKLIENLKGSARILDIGCALGFFLEVAKENGFSPYGIDISPYAVSYASKKFMGRVFCKRIEEAGFKKNYFDAVTLFQTIEHFDNPLGSLKKINTLLKKGGLVILATPDHNSFMRKILGSHWFEYKLDEHLFFFDKSSILNLFEKTGFKLRFIGKDTFFYPFSYIFERIAYYSDMKVIKVLFGKIDKLFENPILEKVSIPLPLGGMIVVGEKL